MRNTVATLALYMGLLSEAVALAPVLVSDLNTFPEGPRSIGEIFPHDERIYVVAETGDSSAALLSAPMLAGSLRIEQNLAPFGLSSPASSSGPLYYVKSYGTSFVQYRIEAYFGSGQVWVGPELGSWPYTTPQRIVTVENRAFFFMPTEGLYVTDGSDIGTSLIHPAYYVLPTSLQSLGDRAVFATQETGFELWTTDGSPSGTVSLLDEAWDVLGFVDAVTIGNEYWALLRDGCTGLILIRTTGTPEGTQYIQFDLGQGPPCLGPPDSFTIHQGEAFITTSHGFDEYRITRLDPDSEESELVIDSSSPLLRITSLGDALIYQSAWGDGEQQSLYRLSAGPKGYVAEPIQNQGEPVLVAPPESHPRGNTPYPILSDRILTNCGAVACSSAAEDDTLEIIGEGLRLANETSGVTRSDSDWWFAGEADLQAGLWRSNGFASGTERVHQIQSPTSSSFPYGPNPVAWLGEALFAANLNLCSLGSPCFTGLMRSDGSIEGTSVIDQPSAGWQTTTGLHSGGNQIFVHGYAEGNIVVSLAADLGNPTIVAAPESMPDSFFMTNDPRDPAFVLASCGDHLDSGICAQRIGEINWVDVMPPAWGTQGCAIPKPLGSMDGVALFAAEECPTVTALPFVLWASEGSPGTTRVIANVDASCGSGTAVTYNGHLYFCGNDDSDSGLWRTGGTPDTTARIASIGFFSRIVAGKLLYLLGSSDNQNAIWRSDGTEVGTYPIRIPGAVLSMEAVGDYLHWVEKVDFVEHYWISDGTTAGTRQLPDHPLFKPAGSIFALPEALEGLPTGQWAAVFRCEFEGHGHELCGINEDGSNWALVADIAPGERGSFPDSFVSEGSSVFFVADNQSHGRELHQLRSLDRVFYSGFQD